MLAHMQPFENLISGSDITNYQKMYVTQYIFLNTLMYTSFPSHCTLTVGKYNIKLNLESFSLNLDSKI